MAKATKWEDVKADLRAKGRFDDEKVQANMERLRSEIRMHRPTEIREALGITQQLLAEQIGISQSRVSQIERVASLSTPRWRRSVATSESSAAR